MSQLRQSLKKLEGHQRWQGEPKGFSSEMIASPQYRRDYRRIKLWWWWCASCFGNRYLLLKNLLKMFIERVSNFFHLQHENKMRKGLVVRLQYEGWLCATAVQGLYEFFLSGFRNIWTVSTRQAEAAVSKNGIRVRKQGIRDPKATGCL